MTRSTPSRSAWRRLADVAFAAATGAALLLTVVVLTGLALGWRPIVIQTGSMGDAAPQDSMLVAAPVAAADIEVGDVIVMRRPGSATVTHRVVEIDQRDGRRVAITQGDANTSPDPTPYPLEGDQLVGRYAVRGAGHVVRLIHSPLLVLGIMVVLVAAATTSILRRIWGVDATPQQPPPGDGSPGEADSGEGDPAWPWAMP